MARNEAGSLIEKAADLLHATMHPGDELGSRRTEVPIEVADRIDEAIRLLTAAQPLLDPGVGPPRTEAGIAMLHDAAKQLRPMPGVFLPTDVTHAREGALRLIGLAERAAPLT